MAKSRKAALRRQIEARERRLQSLLRRALRTRTKTTRHNLLEQAVMVDAETVLLREELDRQPRGK
jgi:hypothetical protein